MINVTWMPYASINKSVGSLTDAQIEDAWTASYHTLRTLLGCRNPIRSNNLRLWRGYEIALSNYTLALLSEISRRGMLATDEHELFWAVVADAPRVERIHITLDDMMNSTRKLSESHLLPKWFGWHALHESHRKALESEDISILVWPWSKREQEGRRAVLASTASTPDKRVVARSAGQARRNNGRNDRSSKALAS